MHLLLVLVGLGQCQQDHGQLLAGYLALCIVADALQDGLLKVAQILRVVVLEEKKRCIFNSQCTTPYPLSTLS